MIRQERRTWKLSEGQKRPKKPRVLVPKSWNPTALHFYLSDKILSKTTRKKSVQSWDDFFVELRKTWKLKVGRGNTIEKLQRETFNVIVDWFAWFHGSELFSRGRARAIEELMQSFSWLIVLEGEKFKDKCRWMEAVVEEQQSKVMRWEVAVFLRGKFLGVAFNPFELHLLKEEYKRVGRAYLRKHYKVKFANADTNENAAIKAIFLPPKRRRKQPVGETYSFREKHQ